MNPALLRISATAQTELNRAGSCSMRCKSHLFWTKRASGNSTHPRIRITSALSAAANNCSLLKGATFGLRLGSKSRSIRSSTSFGNWPATTKIGFFTLVSPISEARIESAANPMHAVPLENSLRSSYLVRVGHAQQSASRGWQNIPEACVNHAEVRVFGVTRSHKPGSTSQIGILNISLHGSIPAVLPDSL